MAWFPLKLFVGPVVDVGQMDVDTLSDSDDDLQDASSEAKDDVKVSLQISLICCSKVWFTILQNAE